MRGLLGARGRSPVTGPLEVGVHHGVEGGVQRLEPLDGGLDELHRADLAVGDQLGLFGGVEVAEFVVHPRRRY